MTRGENQSLYQLKQAKDLVACKQRDLKILYSDPKNLWMVETNPVGHNLFREIDLWQVSPTQLTDLTGIISL